MSKARKGALRVPKMCAFDTALLRLTQVLKNRGMRTWILVVSTALVVSAVRVARTTPLVEGVAQESVQEANDRYVREWTSRLGDQATRPSGEVFENIRLEWLKPVPANRLLAIMNGGYAKALGVRCTYCHSAEDFASDAKRPKNAAREMALMHRSINQQLAQMQHLADPPADRPINCATCHRGTINPNATERQP